MADHFADQIIAAVVTKLTGLTTTGSNVFAEDDYPREAAKLPCLNIYADQFERQRRGPAGSGRPETENLLIIVVQGVAREKNSARKKAWQIAKEVEAKWLGTTNDERLVGLITKPIHSAQIVACEVSIDQGDRAIAVAEMQFQVKVLSFEGKPDLT